MHYNDQEGMGMVLKRCSLRQTVKFMFLVVEKAQGIWGGKPIPFIFVIYPLG